ncbi:MAG: YggT family protein [Sterolibacterium sp.]|jgi:YggT family protein|nr:YggT family protein [Sterolibacterium sp.]
MLIQLLLQILDWGFSLLTMALLTRLLMQWARVPFRNPLGQFVMAVTDWIVLPARRLIPAAGGVDLPCLLLAWLAQAMYQGVFLGLMMASTSALAPGGFFIVALLAALAVIRLGLYLLMGVVIVSALFSWFNPHAPLAPLLGLMSRPFLAPLQRVIPPLGGVDFSPMALLLILQVLLAVLGQAQFHLLPPLFLR